MADLYPTRTRMILLSAIVNGEVYDHYGDAVIINGPKVTARVIEAEAAGWIEPNGVAWSLTDAGRAVLDAYLRGER